MENKYKNIALFAVCIIVMVFATSQLQAQQDSQYTQYMYNTQTVNPAYAGTRGVFGITSLYRNQWVGLEGAPETLNLSLSTPLGESQRVGLGVSFIKDKVGPADESTLVADFSYTIPVGERTNLSFGLKGGFNLLNVDYGVLTINNPNDALQQFNIDNRTKVVAGLGLYLHDIEKWYVGVSIPNFLETTHYDDTNISNASEKANAYAIAGYVFNLSDNTKFKPAVLGKFIQGAPIGLDLSANFLLYEKFTLGAAYRLDAAVSALAGFQITEGMFIGYSYDYGTQELANFNSGSHEIFLRFEFANTKTDRFLTPRFF
ncbi:PorP/SprF family type IX secretion system membrane protein [Lacinutrix jangbogonensis]|uniref:PorP/SprF family type IX secretion system membrane protein n=1 Tax=Lacinutrix jangbogonensis TaxID=1469557 RepID=UPI00053D2BA3|nr:type IX secretion system membrane protein PorP/SprF [Lacinutrix jangbogonensis]